MGTGSAFKDGGLQGDGLKAVLATAVVFGRACGAASTTLMKKQMKKHRTTRKPHFFTVLVFGKM